ncbi:hypothetical protein MIT9_P2525 [Methylomarinovum caldicuralii]|uniref:NYN domain-containing protein n=1 Tax=Methylomarinovum caldicuralii TaxID=438856 RepID=A0AAU9CA62_9GAMM|nr:NYN domain-containing protein [Methylomarinovum caldicuralii]BCX82934.1 hypothetical protein MIT9_P2525 [Methylomarinovum caldicuralii]
MVSNRGRTIVFIDNSNIFGGQQAAGWRLDWEKLIDYLRRGGDIWQVHFFASVDEKASEGQMGFYRYLKEVLNWEVHLYPLGYKRTRCSHCGQLSEVRVEKGVDVALATRMLILGINRAYDTAILVSGDGDYKETVWLLKNTRGLRVEIVAWRRSLSAELAEESSSKIVYLDDLRDLIEKNDIRDPAQEGGALLASD